MKAAGSVSALPSNQQARLTTTYFSQPASFITACLCKSSFCCLVHFILLPIRAQTTEARKKGTCTSKHLLLSLPQRWKATQFISNSSRAMVSKVWKKWDVSSIQRRGSLDAGVTWLFCCTQDHIRSICLETNSRETGTEHLPLQFPSRLSTVNDHSLF